MGDGMVKPIGGPWRLPLKFSSVLTKAFYGARFCRSHSSGRNMMNQYLVFTYYVGRSWGGMKDFLDSFDTIEEALENLLPEPRRYYQIVDRDTLKIVKEGLTIFKDCDPSAFRKG
jgi:hypothetical protein